MQNITAPVGAYRPQRVLHRIPTSDIHKEINKKFFGKYGFKIFRGLIYTCVFIAIVVYRYYTLSTINPDSLSPNEHQYVNNFKFRSYIKIVRMCTLITVGAIVLVIAKKNMVSKAQDLITSQYEFERAKFVLKDFKSKLIQLVENDESKLQNDELIFSLNEDKLNSNSTMKQKWKDKLLNINAVQINLKDILEFNKIFEENYDPKEIVFLLKIQGTKFILNPYSAEQFKMSTQSASLSSGVSSFIDPKKKIVLFQDFKGREEETLCPQKFCQILLNCLNPAKTNAT